MCQKHLIALIITKITLIFARKRDENRRYEVNYAENHA